VGLTAEETSGLNRVWPETRDKPNPEKWYEYSAVIECPGNTPDNPEDVLCSEAVTYCEATMPGSQGPYSMIWRRVVDGTGPIDFWERVGPTCYTAEVPPRSGDDVELTEAMIIEQFHRTEFAAPTISLQPADNRTLVNLPVYFELLWPVQGYEPMEVDTTDLLGREVRIRPVLDSATYHFGDGDSQGPTTSLGGPYPSGDITHDYTAAAQVTPHITVVYGGEVSVDGAAWITIPGSVTIDGPTQPLEVMTSRNRLYDD